jgi:hypothetical protein
VSFAGLAADLKPVSEYLDILVVNPGNPFRQFATVIFLVGFSAGCDISGLDGRCIQFQSLEYMIKIVFKALHSTQVINIVEVDQRIL